MHLSHSLTLLFTLFPPSPFPLSFPSLPLLFPSQPILSVSQPPHSLPLPLPRAPFPFHCGKRKGKESRSSIRHFSPHAEKGTGQVKSCTAEMKYKPLTGQGEGTAKSHERGRKGAIKYIQYSSHSNAQGTLLHVRDICTQGKEYKIVLHRMDPTEDLLNDHWRFVWKMDAVQWKRGLFFSAVTVYLVKKASREMCVMHVHFFYLVYSHDKISCIR